VAVTRARDRLYFAATVNADGRFVAGKGGLGRTLPPAFAALFSEAASLAATARASEPTRPVIWTAASGAHRLRVLTTSTDLIQLSDGGSVNDDSVDDFAPFSPDGPRRVVPAGHEIDTEGIANEPGIHPRPDELAAEMFGGASDISWWRPDVPFSLRRSDGTIIRGTIDYVVKRSSGALEALAVKTGQPTPDDQAHLDDCLAAARALFPEDQVVGRVIYADYSWQLSGR
jgi:hypothetical protein